MSSQTDAPKPFVGWREKLWPIHYFELKKVVPMLGIFFFVTLNYSLLRTLKDTLISGGMSGRTEYLPLLKVFGVLPAAILFLPLVNWMASRFSSKRTFQILISSFLGFFLLFSWFLYPNMESLQLNSLADWLYGCSSVATIQHIAELIRHWPKAIFYIAAELWGSIALSFLFWGLANETTRIEDGKRLFPILGLGGNMAPLCLVFIDNVLKRAINFFWKFDPKLQEAAYTEKLVLLTLLLTAFGAVVILSLHYYLTEYVLKDPRFAVPQRVAKKKKRLGFLESFKVFKSPYLCQLAGLVICYGLVINLVEIPYKELAKVVCETKPALTSFNQQVTSATAVVTVLAMLFLGNNMLRWTGWLGTALVTPIALASTGGLFLIGLMSMNSVWLAKLALCVGFNDPRYLVLSFGIMQQMLSKGLKYAMFDPTKELLYVPLEPQERIEGKAAVDVLGARLGKSGGALINIGLQNLSFLSSPLAYAPYSSVLCSFFLGYWALCDFQLAKKFKVLEQASLEASAAASRAATQTADR